MNEHGSSSRAISDSEPDDSELDDDSEVSYSDSDESEESYSYSDDSEESY